MISMISALLSLSALSAHEPAVIIDWSSAEISGGFSESTPAEKPDTPGRGLFPSRLCHPRKYPGVFQKVRPRTSLINPAGHYIGNRQRYIGAFYRTIILKLIREQGSRGTV